MYHKFNSQLYALHDHCHGRNYSYGLICDQNHSRDGNVALVSDVIIITVVIANIAVISVVITIIVTIATVVTIAAIASAAVMYQESAEHCLKIPQRCLLLH